MLFRTIRKNKILRVLCMIMLMLIHLDAYMYEAINAFQVETVEQSVSFAEDTSLQEEEAGMPSWVDLSYSNSSARLSWWNTDAVFLPLLLLFSFIPIVRIRNSVQTSLSLGTLHKVRPHLAFCTFLI